MSGLILSILPIFTFAVVFSLAPEFYLNVAGERAFIIGMVILLSLYFMGIFIMHRMVQLKV
jgi:tight adherence protein B